MNSIYYCLVVLNLEKEAIKRLPFELLFYVRYVDDILLAALSGLTKSLTPSIPSTNVSSLFWKLMKVDEILNNRSCYRLMSRCAAFSDFFIRQQGCDYSLILVPLVAHYWIMRAVTASMRVCRQ